MIILTPGGDWSHGERKWQIMKELQRVADSAGMATSLLGHCERNVRPYASLWAGEFGRPMEICAIIASNAIIASMASITIRNLEESTRRKLKVRAARNGNSMEQEVREIIKSALRQQNLDWPKTGAELAESIHRRFARLGGLELEPLPKEFMPDPDWLKERKA